MSPVPPVFHTVVTVSIGPLSNWTLSTINTENRLGMQRFCSLPLSFPLHLYHLWICLSLSLSFCEPVWPSVCPFVCLSICLSVCLNVCVSVCLPFCLSICLSIFFVHPCLCFAWPKFEEFSFDTSYRKMSTWALLTWRANFYKINLNYKELVCKLGCFIVCTCLSSCYECILMKVTHTKMVYNKLTSFKNSSSVWWDTRMLNFHIFLQNNFCLLLRDFSVVVVVVVVQSDCLFGKVNVLLETRN